VSFDMAGHVEQLCRDLGITLEYLKGGNRGWAQRKERRIKVSPVKGISTYYTALHEIAHIVGPNAPRRLEQEVAAWRWAIDNAKRPPTKGVWKGIAASLDSYRQRGERAVWGTKLPAPEHDFWTLLCEAEEGSRVKTVSKRAAA
jgi:hypothetical protein